MRCSPSRMENHNLSGEVERAHRGCFVASSVRTDFLEMAFSDEPCQSL